jgi:N-acetylglucosamine repressor
MAALPEKATHQQTRTFNQQLVLRAIYDGSRTSRADVARLTGLTRTSVSALVGDLIGLGLVAEVGHGPSRGGKNPILLSIATDGRHILGLDLGEDDFRGAVVNLRGEILASESVPLGGTDGRTALELLLTLIERLRARATSPLLGIGIGTPGVIDSRTGTVRWAVNLDWADLPLGPIVADRFGLPTVVANDSQASALAELTFAGRQRPANLVVVRVSRGIGAGIIVDGKLFQGDGAGAGEIGHTIAVPDGERCRCGSVGCLETVASLGAMVRLAGRLAPEVRDEATLLRAAAAGDDRVRGVVVEAGRLLGRGIAGLIGALNINRVMLVGPAVALGSFWLEAVRETACLSALPLLARDTRIELGNADDDVVLGASALLMTHELGLNLVR